MTGRPRSTSISNHHNRMILLMQKRLSVSFNFEAPILNSLSYIEPIVITDKQLETNPINVHPIKYCTDPENNFQKTTHKTESAWTALGQLMIPFLIAGMGNVAAGIVLDIVQHWDAFQTIPQLVILIPALLGLKGNVEMTLASRLSTHANLGHMDDAADLKSMIISNMALVQCQASTVGLIAPIVAIGLSLLTKEGTSISSEHVLIIITSSVVTANIANLILGSIMCLIIYLSRKININPDNIATPIAASLGDFTTLILLAYISHMLFIFSPNPWLSKVLLIFLLLLIPLWVVIARRNYYTRPVLLNGWIPILGAMLLQNAGGLIMEKALNQFQNVAAVQPIINGVGGNLVAVQSSRISTYLNSVSKPRVLPETDPFVCVSPLNVFFGKNPHSLMARLLILIAAPSHILFLFILRFFEDHFKFTFPFLALYIIAALIQISLLLYLCYCMVHLMWKFGVDPDNSSIPFLTALADLIGAFLLAGAFFILSSVNDPNASNDFTTVTLTN